MEKEINFTFVKRIFFLDFIKRRDYVNWAKVFYYFIIIECLASDY